MIAVRNYFTLLVLNVRLLVLEHAQLVVETLPLSPVEPHHLLEPKGQVLRDDLMELFDVDLENRAGLADALGAVRVRTDASNVLEAEQVTRTHDDQIIRLRLRLVLLHSAL